MKVFLIIMGIIIISEIFDFILKAINSFMTDLQKRLMTFALTAIRQ